jgi:hypothetical protein
MCCSTASSDMAKERERKSAIVLVFPLVKTVLTVAFEARQSVAKCCRRKAGGPVVVGEPLVTQEYERGGM